MKKLKNPILGAMALGAAAVSLPASAGIQWFDPITGFEDDNLEFYIDNSAGGNGTLDVGDVLVSVVEIAGGTYSVIPAGGTVPITGGELTGVAAVEVLQKTLAFDGGTPLDPTDDRYNFVMGAPQVGLNTYLGGNTVIGGAAGGQAMVAFYFDNTPELTIGGCADINDCTNKAVDGNLWGVFGFAGDDDEFWTANLALDTIATAAAAPSTSSAADVNFALSSIGGQVPRLLGQQTCTVCPGTDQKIEMIGGGTVKGGQGLGATGSFARSDFDFQLAPIPEPSLMALTGLGLLGLGGMMRSRRRKSA